MSVPCEHLPWDSEFFGFQVARVVGGALTSQSGQQIIEWCRREHVRLLYFLAEDDVAAWAAAAESGFRLVDLRVELLLDMPWQRMPGAELAPGVLLREATAEDLPELLPIAASVHTDSRFFADSKIPREKACELFKTWLRRSVEGAIADLVFVAELNRQAVAYISTRMADGEGSIGLVGVGEGARGRGIGVALVRRALEWFVAHNARRVSVVTQGRNIVAQHVYQRSGFFVSSVRPWFHRWFQ